MSDPTAIGARVLAVLAAGRAQRLEARRRRADELRELVLRAARLDRAAGRPDRGRAGRIARRLELGGVEITERWVAKILGTVGPAVPHGSTDSQSDRSTQPTRAA